MSASKGKTILLVEDETILAMTEKMQLEKYGYIVKTARTGENAVESVNASPDIDLVLMDINLGDGIDGTEAAGIILKDHDIPIVFVSSHTEPEIVEKTEKITSYGYVVKNSSITVLDASIKMAFKLFEAKKKESEKEKALLLSEEKYRLISENTSDGIIHFNSDGIIDYASPSYLKQLGYKKLEQFGKGCDAIIPEIHPDDSDAMFASIHEAVNNKQGELTYIFRVKNSKGDYIWREDHANYLYDSSGSYLGAYVSCRDITDRKNIESELIVLGKAIEASPVIIIITDVKGIIKYVNPRFTYVTGYSSEEVIGKNPRFLKSGKTEKNVYADLWSTLTSGNEWKGYFKNKKKNGEIYYESATIAPVKNNKGEITNYIAVKEDLTEKRYIQESLEESNVRFNTLANAQSVLIWESGLDKLCTYFNPTWLSYTGRALEEELGNGWSEGVHPEDLERCLEIYTEAFDQGKEFSMEYRLRKANGEYGWILDHGSPKYHDKEFIGYIGACIDISHNKEIEKVLRESEEKYKLLHENAGVGIGYYTNDGIVLSYNRLAAKHLGGVPEEFSGKSIYELFPKPDADVYLDRIKRTSASKASVVYEDIVPLAAGNKYFLSTFTRISDIHGNLSGIQIISQDITDRKQMEEALRESKQKAEMLLNIAAEIIISEDLEGNILLLNESGHRILGYESPMLVGKNFFDLCLPDDNREDVRRYFNSLKYLDADSIVNHQNDVITSTGERKTIQWHNSILKDKDGNAFGVFSSGEDVSERMRAEQALQLKNEEYEVINEELKSTTEEVMVQNEELIQSQELLMQREKQLVQAEKVLAQSLEKVQLLLNSAAEGIYGVDLDDNCTFCNDSCLQLLGYTHQEELLGKNMHWQIHGKYPDGTHYPLESCRMYQAIQKGLGVHSADEVIWRSDGTSFPAEYWSYPQVKNGKVVGAVVSLLDIADRKQTEQALRESQERLLFALEGSDLGEWDWNLKTNILKRNERWARMLGYSLAEISDTLQQGVDLQHPDDREGAWKAVQAHLDGMTDSYSIEYRMLTKSGSYKWIHDCGKIMERDWQGKPMRICGTHADIDDQKRAGDRIRTLLAEKELLLKEVHHRIKNNMNTISSLLSMQSAAMKEPSALVALQDAVNRIQSMSLLYDKLYRSTDFTELSVNEYMSALIDRVVAHFPTRQNIETVKDLQDFTLDVNRLQPLAIMINELLTNIMKYAFNGKQDGQINVSAKLLDKRVTIIVQDDGIGIPESVSFENSTGFGLQLVDALARQLDGTVGLERGNGTKITLEFMK